MTRTRLLPLSVALVWALACTGGNDDPSITAAADAKVKSGDLPGAASEYDKASKDNATSMYAKEGEAYSLLLQGKYDEADKQLADAAATETAKKDPKLVSEIELRRAIIALRAGKLDDVKQHGAASNLPAGLVLAAEVHLADAESDDALKLLKQASSDPGVVGQTAQTYVQMLESDDPLNPGLAEATALWALGNRDVAVEAAEELVKALPEEREDKNMLLLLWAGRAVTAKRPGIATGMLDSIGFPPEGQAWRIQATRAMIAIAEGDDAEGIKIFTQLASAGADVPADGLSDALATAAALTTNKETARTLAGELRESAAAARGLSEAGAVEKAKQAAPEGPLKQYLGG
jgi:tetratricopeptide (TPR) repeat protein